MQTVLAALFITSALFISEVGAKDDHGHSPGDIQLPPPLREYNLTLPTLPDFSRGALRFPMPNDRSPPQDERALGMIPEGGSSHPADFNDGAYAQSTSSAISGTVTPSLTAVPSDTESWTVTASLTAVPSDTESWTVTASLTAVPSDTESWTVTASLTAVPSDTESWTVTPSLAAVPSVPGSSTVTLSPTVVPNVPGSRTVTPSPTVVPSVPGSRTVTPSPTVVSSVPGSRTVTPSPTVVPSVPGSRTVTPSPTVVSSVSRSRTELIPSASPGSMGLRTASLTLSLSSTPSSLVCPDDVSLVTWPTVRIEVDNVREGFRLLGRLGNQWKLLPWRSGVSEFGDEMASWNASTLRIACRERKLGMMSRMGCSHFMSLIQSGVHVNRNESGLFELIFPPIEKFYIDARESIDISAPVDMVLGCRVAPPSNPPHAQQSYFLRRGEQDIPLYPLVSVAVSPVTQPVYVGSTGEAGRVSAMFSLLGAPFGVPGINYVTVLSMMHCTPDATRRTFGNYRSISVATIEDSFCGVMIGNLIIIGVVIVVHVVVVVSLRLKDKASWTRVAEHSFFPGIPLLVLVNLFVGTSFASMQGLTSKVASTLVLSTFMLLVFVGGLVAALCVSMAKLRLTFYPILSFEGMTFLSKNSCLSFVATGWLLRVGGFWLPATVANGFFLLLMNLRRSRVVWVTLWLWAPLIVAVFGVLPVQTVDGCIGIHFVLILCHLIFFGAVAVFRPLISPLDNGYYLVVMLVSVWLLAVNIQLLLHPDDQIALFAACTAAVVAIVAFCMYIILKTLQVVVFAGRKWTGVDVRGAPGTRYREPNQTALFNLPKGHQKQPDMSTSSSSPQPAAGGPLVAPRVRNLVDRTVTGDPGDRILPGQQVSPAVLNELTTDNAVAALERARPVVPLRDSRAGEPQRPVVNRWSSFGSPSIDSLESIDLDLWSVGVAGEDPLRLGV